MEKGFQLDHGHGVILQSQWVRGDPKERRWFDNTEAKFAQLTDSLRVDSYRCPSCGLLESYANNPARTA